eukprot:14961_1
MKPQSKLCNTNPMKLSISVMGVTRKQRSIYINTWINIKAFEKKRQPVRTTYGQLFHFKHTSSKILLDLFVHDIRNNTKIHKLVDSIILNVIVLPYNHTNSTVNNLLKTLLNELQDMNISLEKLFSKTLLICPYNFHSMTKQQYVTQTKKVSQRLLDLIHNELAIQSNLTTSDIIMMQSDRRLSTLPTGKNWRLSEAEYVLKHLIVTETQRKAFILCILNSSKPLTTQHVSFLKQKLQKKYTSRRRLKKKHKHSSRKKYGAKTKLQVNNNNDNDNLRIRKERPNMHNNTDLAGLLDLSDDETQQINMIVYKQQKQNVNKIESIEEEVMHPDLAGLLDLSDDEAEQISVIKLVNFTLSWNHIISAVKQELSQERAAMIMDIINDKQYKNISINHTPHKSWKTLLKIISKKKRFIYKKELQYIQQLIQRAINFMKNNANNDDKINDTLIKNFEYSYDFDENGLLYYLNENYEFCPYTLTSSSLDEKSAELEHFADAPIKWNVQTEKSNNKSFIAIHFNEIKLKVKKISFKDYNFNTNECDISFQASYDGTKWITVKQFEVNNDNINKCYSWGISSDDKQYFSHFRLFCKPKVGNVLCNLECCGLELYGDVKSMNRD